ncbi:glycosyltransferase family 2 protein [Pararhodospirillum oryzae]|uniref:Glycosyltransferase 2-like domain-containing protein n=1 Tax=Pararhodospirillum oryzae TaxID=478448 RepID=A0A512H3U1_9PROT|nr:glycosyltransferase [Pararhodospirillum oryzae]GEO80136.1 hypothetical protein ROR02_02670 [Pararhodospirillum oryzae]
MTTPIAISVIMACRNAGRFLDAALRSVRAQSLGDIEILVVDDASTDDTARRCLAHAAQDPRIRLLRGQGVGPGAARALAVAAARGAWLAIVDADDLIHPRRLELLHAEGEASGAEIVADTVIAFHDQPGYRRAFPLLQGAAWTRLTEISLPAYIDANRLFERVPSLGYLKPLIRRQWLAETGIEYDPDLRIGEDYDLMVRLLAAGGRFRVIPTPLYLYRRHAGSTSHRMRSADIEALHAAGERFLAGLPDGDARVAARRRQVSLRTALHFSRAVDALKQGQALQAARLCVSRPRAGVLLARALAAAVRNRLQPAWRRLAPPGRRPPDVLVLGPDRRTATDTLARLRAAGLRSRYLATPPGADQRGLEAVSASCLVGLATTLAGLDPPPRLIAAEPLASDLRPFLIPGVYEDAPSA